MRLFLAIIAIGFLAVLSVPFVFAQDTAMEPATSDTAVKESCRGTFGEYRVHCLEGLRGWEA